MITRVITACLGIPLLFFIVNSGGYTLFIALLIVASIGLFEYTHSINRQEDIQINYFLEIVLGILIISSFYYNKEVIIPCFILSFMILFTYQILKNKVYVLQGIYAFFGLFYVPFLLGHLLLFSNLPNGRYIIWLVFVISFSTDTFAYIFGLSIGRHKLCPKISPKKSVEGAIGGVIGSLSMTLIYGYFMNKYGLLDFNYSFYILISIIASIMSQIGDLTASLIKRTFGVKDFGSILPGHGGVLDRFDSVLFTTPVVYYIAKHLILMG